VTHGNSAARLSETAQKYEAANRCMQSPSLLLAGGGATSASRPGDGSSDSLPYYLLAVVCAGLIVVATVLRRNRAALRAPRKQPTGVLEVLATIVGICAGIAGLATQFAPELQPHTPPPRSAELLVRSVDTRIARRDLASTLRAKKLSDLTGRQVGNVIWLQMHLVGYRARTLSLAWGAYANDATGPLIATTTGTIPVPVSNESDEQIVFVPVWVGYPGVQRFHVRFVLLDDRGRVQELAKTGGMNGNLARFVCREHASHG
jgi:hypothetical protein